jgi:hypothetical protein
LQCQWMGDDSRHRVGICRAWSNWGCTH